MGLAAVAEDQGQLAAGRVAELGGCGRVLAQVVDGDFAERPGAFADLPQFLECPLPHDVRRGDIHHEGEARLAPPGRAQHRHHEAGVGGAVGRSDLVEIAADRAHGRAVALQGPQRALECRGVGQRGGGRHRNPAHTGGRYACWYALRLRRAVQVDAGPRRRSRPERGGCGRLRRLHRRTVHRPCPGLPLGYRARRPGRGGRHMPGQPQRVRQLLGRRLQFRLAQPGDKRGQRRGRLNGRRNGSGRRNGRVHSVTAAGCRGDGSAARRSPHAAPIPPVPPAV